MILVRKNLSTRDLLDNRVCPSTTFVDTLSSRFVYWYRNDTEIKLRVCLLLYSSINE